MKMMVFSDMMKSNGICFINHRGEHLVNFDADHSEVVGISGTLSKIQTFELALENINTIEQQQTAAQ